MDMVNFKQKTNYTYVFFFIYNFSEGIHFLKVTHMHTSQETRIKKYDRWWQLEKSLAQVTVFHYCCMPTRTISVARRDTGERLMFLMGASLLKLIELKEVNLPFLNYQTAE